MKEVRRMKFLNYGKKKIPPENPYLMNYPSEEKKNQVS